MTVVAMLAAKSVGLKSGSGGGLMATGMAEALETAGSKIAGVIMKAHYHHRLLLEGGVGGIVAGLGGGGFSMILFVGCPEIQFEGY